MLDAQISIIIPVYNVCQYLEECIYSVTTQSFKNIEIILVDDGSIDGSAKICDDFAEKDNRICVIHQKNGGLSHARNVGINLAKGKYLYFLDADDVIDKDTLLILFSECEITKADVAMSTSKSFVGKIKRSKQRSYIDEIVSEEEAIRRMLLHLGVGHEAWGKLYRSELWRNEAFPKGKLYEDYAVMYNIIMKCNSVVIINRDLYYYRIRNGSIIRSKIGQKDLEIINISDDVTRSICHRFPTLNREAEYLQLKTYMKTLKRILDVNFNMALKEQYCILKFVHQHQNLLDIKWVRMADKIKIKILLKNKRLFYLVYTVGEMCNFLKIKYGVGLN